MLEEEGVLRCCLYVLVPSALVIVVTAEKAGPKVVSILVPVVASGAGRLAGPPEKRLYQALLPELML